VVVTPAAVGGGTPFFPTMDKWITLELVENRTFPSGAVLLRYVAKNLGDGDVGGRRHRHRG
jgi:hypothetical protein